MPIAVAEARNSARVACALQRAEPPRAIVLQLHAAVLQALQDPIVRKRFVDNGADATPSATPEEFGAFIKSETAKWARVIKDANIRAD